MNTISDCKMIKLKDHDARNGILNAIDFTSLPFVPKRCFYVYGVTDNEERGLHAHYKTEQILFCLKGLCIVSISDGKKQKTITLNNPNTGIYIPAMIWDSQIYGYDTILMVLSSTKYNGTDYIHDYEEFKRLKNG